MSDKPNDKPSNKTNFSPTKFGTFGGVFTPCTLTILGVIMFLRFGQVVGQAGAIYALIIVLLAKLITTLTAFSLSAIATNTRVKGGGAYYLISRSLGVELGGTIGIIFFLAQAISVAMYVIGFTEAFIDSFPQILSLQLPIIGPVTVTIVASLVNLLVFICVMIGAGWTIKLQYGILALLFFSLFSFYWGAFQDFSWVQLQASSTPSYKPGQNFFTIFALFFPAVTGIMAGANMSGDLKEPSRSIPKGTIFSILFTTLVYLSMALLLAGSRSQEALINNNMIIKEMSWFPFLIVLGVFSATLSSALSSMMGAPRILQAFARDEVFKSLKIFARSSGKNQEPRFAITLTFLISQICICLADLDAIAPIVTMFFMITYGTINLATFYESITGNPSYRPTFRYSHWSTELLGAVGCIAVMFLMSPLWAILSIALMITIYGLISRKEIETRWGDVRSGLAFEKIRKNLLNLQNDHPKNWRPIVLALSGGAWSRMPLTIYARWLTAGRGLLTLGQIIVGDIYSLLERRVNQEKILKKFIQEEEMSAWATAVVAPSLPAGIHALVQCHGIGEIRPNTVLIGWNRDPERSEGFATIISTLARLKRNVVAIRYQENNEDPHKAPEGTIDVWWRGMSNGKLMLLFAHLLKQNSEWRTHKIRLLRIISSSAGIDKAREHLQELIELSRIEATPVVIASDNAPQAIQETSAHAAVVFIGFQPPEKEQESDFVRKTNYLMGDLRTVILVASVGGMELDA